VDHAWAADQLKGFQELVDILRNYSGEYTTQEDADYYDHIVDQFGSFHDVVDRLVTMDPVMRDLMEAARSGFGEYPTAAFAGYQEYSSEYWRGVVRPWVLRAIGVHTLGAEAHVRMRPDSPDLVADQLHPWVWDAAMPLWSADSKQEAVQVAARSVNARLQQRLDRRDIADAALCREAFSFKEPGPKKPRLRFPGDRASETWRSRQQGGLDFGAGCFEGIRNPASHEHELNMSHMVALEQLAALSVLARWIDECVVERDESGSD
jgi:Protein of unknown function (Hypoth_ymh)